MPDDSVPYATGEVCNLMPLVDVSPPSGYVSQTAVPVTVTASDHFIGNAFGSFRILLDGVDVTAQWNVTQTDAGSGTGMRRTFRATGVVTLGDSLGERTLEARLDDTQWEGRAHRTWKLMRPGVEVGQDGASLVELPAATRTAPFTVKNTGVASATFALTAECRDGLGQRVTPCSVSPASRTLAAKASATVTATYPAVQEGGTVTVVVRARQEDAPGVEDAGWTDVAIRSPGGQRAAAAQVSLVPLNAGAVVEKWLWRGRGRRSAVARILRGEESTRRQTATTPAQRKQLEEPMCFAIRALGRSCVRGAPMT